MRLLILSDLHLEVWRDYGPKFDITVSSPDVVVLAGDIHTKGRAPGWAAKVFPETPVLYISGNHEFYGDTLDQMDGVIRRECEKYANIHYLDRDELIIQGVRFLGVTLWTDFYLFGPDQRFSAMSSAGNAMNDYQRIRIASEGYRKVRPSDTARLHAQQKLWLNDKLDEPFAGATVVITHMAPTRHSVAAEYAADPVSAAFASVLDELVYKADLWIHGHTHSSFDYTLGQCRVVANPLGYMKRGGQAENSEFNPNFIVEVHP